MSERTIDDQGQLDALEVQLKVDHAQDAADVAPPAEPAAEISAAEPSIEPSAETPAADVAEPEPAAEPTPEPEPAPIVLNVLDRTDAPELPAFVEETAPPEPRPSTIASVNGGSFKALLQRPSLPTDPAWPTPHPLLRATVRYTMADLTERDALVLALAEDGVAVLNVKVALSSDERIQTQQVAAVPYGAVGEALTWHEADAAPPTESTS